VAVGAILAAAVVGTVTPASAGDRTAAKIRTDWISRAGTSTPDRDDSQIPAPQKPKQTRPAERVLTEAVPTTSTSAAATATTSAIAAGAASLKGESVVAAAEAVAAPVGVSGKGAPGADTLEKTLLLYDNTGPYAWLGEVYAEQTANLVSHFNAWTAHPVGSYTAGELNGYASVVYVGSTYDEPLPVAFLDDVTTTTKEVVWVYDNIWQLTARDANFVANRGFTWKQFDLSAVSTVNYRGTPLTRDTINGSGIMDHVIYDATKVKVLGEAVRRTAPRSRGRCARATSPTSVRSRSRTSPTTTATSPSPTCSSTRSARHTSAGTGLWSGSRTSARTPTRPSCAR
jgi:hypothetical protein